MAISFIFCKITSFVGIAKAKGADAQCLVTPSRCCLENLAERVFLMPSVFVFHY